MVWKLDIDKAFDFAKKWLEENHPDIKDPSNYLSVKIAMVGVEKYRKKGGVKGLTVLYDIFERVSGRKIKTDHNVVQEIPLDDVGTSILEEANENCIPSVNCWNCGEAVNFD